MGLDFILLNKNKKEIPTDFRIGYSTFSFLRASLAVFVSKEFAEDYTGMITHISNPKPYEEKLNKFLDDHHEQRGIINSFFFHSDCDGQWTRREIDVIIKFLEENKLPPETDPEKWDFPKIQEELLAMLKTPNLHKVIFC